MPLVSIIVPVYKAEAWLDRCADSILAQSFSDFELILVDDGSPDGSPAICDRLAGQDSRIQVLHQENRGASAARNAGLDMARGEYILFCDSDDAVAPDWAAHLLEASQEGRVFPMCGYCQAMEDLGAPSDLLPAGVAFPVREYFRFLQKGLAGFVCNGLFLRSVIEKHRIRFRDCHAQGNYNEDLLFALTYVRHVSAIAFTGFRDYCYDAHAGSLSRSWDRYYFPKYEEKYRLWSAFLTEYLPQDRAAKEDLARTMLYHFFTALKGDFARRSYEEFSRIVSSPEVTACAAAYRGSGENPREVALLRGKHTFLLWSFYTLQKIKHSISPKKGNVL